MNKRIFSLILAGSAALLPVSAAQAVVVPCPGGTMYTGCSFDSAGGTGNFFDLFITGAPLGFLDVFQVTLAAPGTVTITFTHSPGYFTFGTLTFDGQPFAVGTAGTLFYRPAGTYDLTVAGTVTHNASFTGTIDFLEEPPVPEPASWAMMIGGLALVGATMRRRTPAVRFA